MCDLATEYILIKKLSTGFAKSLTFNAVKFILDVNFLTRK